MKWSNPVKTEAETQAAAPVEMVAPVPSEARDNWLVAGAVLGGLAVFVIVMWVVLGMRDAKPESAAPAMIAGIRYAAEVRKLESLNASLAEVARIKADSDARFDAASKAAGERWHARVMEAQHGAADDPNVKETLRKIETEEVRGLLMLGNQATREVGAMGNIDELLAAEIKKQEQVVADAKATADAFAKK